MKTCLVTGAAGFIGSNFVKHILNQEEERKVIVLDALTYAGNLTNLEAFLNGENLLLPSSWTEIEPIKIDHLGNVCCSFDGENLNKNRLKKLTGFSFTVTPREEIGKAIQSLLRNNQLIFIIGNIADQELVSQLMPMADEVVHFAAESHVDRSILNPDTFIKTDVYGTYVLLEEAQKVNSLTSFVHISTDEVYGVATEKSFDEQDPINPRNPYSASKAAADRLAFAYHETYGLPVKIVRPSNNFGPNQYPEKLIPLMTIKALNDERLPVYGDGKQIRDWLYVKDTARAIELVLNAGRNGEVYNIAGKNERENIEIVQAILKQTDKSDNLIEYVTDRPGHDRRYSLNDDKIRKELGFKQVASFEDLLSGTVKWYLNNRSWWEKTLKEDTDYHSFMKKWYDKR